MGFLTLYKLQSAGDPGFFKSVRKRLKKFGVGKALALGGHLPGVGVAFKAASLLKKKGRRLAGCQAGDLSSFLSGASAKLIPGGGAAYNKLLELEGKGLSFLSKYKTPLAGIAGAGAAAVAASAVMGGGRGPRMKKDGSGVTMNRHHRMNPFNPRAAARASKRLHRLVKEMRRYVNLAQHTREKPLRRRKAR